MMDENSNIFEFTISEDYEGYRIDKLLSELIDSVQNWQYNELNPAEYTIMFEPGTRYGVVYDYAKQFQGQMIMSLQTEVYGEKNHSFEYVTVADSGNLYNFQDENGNYINIPDYGISISSKLAYDFDIGIGDFINFRLPGEKKVYSGRIVGLYTVPNGQGIAMTRSYFESLGTEFNPNIVYTNMTVPESYVTERQEVSSVLDKAAFIRSLDKANELKSTEVMCIMAIAVVMGIVVMYNLGVMSFMEKVREIATLKVLGFSTKKIRWILQQQNIAVTGLGTLAGLLVGSKVLVFMMNNLDDESAYIFHLSPVPYILAILLSFVLSIAVNEIISTKVKAINMVEALKGVE